MAILLEIKVFPGAGRQAFTLDSSGLLKCYLKNQAEKGRANDELVKLFALRLGIGRECIVIVKGALVQRKLIKIATTITREEVFKHLGVVYQQSIMKG